MRLILDAGALVAVERGDRDVVALIKRELTAGRAPVTHGGVVGQVWRGGSGRQAPLARLLPGLEIVGIDEDLGRRAGLLLGKARGSDVVDAALVVLAADGDSVLTSDVQDLRRLVEAADTHLDLVPV
jgi:hypothetical protein